MPSTPQCHSFAAHPHETTSLDHINFYTAPTPRQTRRPFRQSNVHTASRSHSSKRCEDRLAEAIEGTFGEQRELVCWVRTVNTNLHQEAVDITSSHEEPETLGILLSLSASPNSSANQLPQQVIPHASPLRPATKEMNNAASMDLGSSDAAVDEAPSASAGCIMHGMDMVPP